MAIEAQDAAVRDLRSLVGTVLADRYRIDEVLGEGGMGLVFRAHHLLLKRDVAVKVLHPELSQNEQLRARFDREAQSAARVEHPNIVHVSEFGSTESGMKYMVMQLLEGCELIELMQPGAPMRPVRVVEIAVQIFRGLEYAHKHGVVHRDLKPENIFVTDDHEGRETIKIVDFGIAKILHTDSDDEAPTTRPLTRHGLVFGTPEYMSPEQATGTDIDERTDIYSAGVIIYEMLAGRLPFSSDDKVALIRMQVASDAPAFESDLPEELGHLVFSMLEKDRDKRPPSASFVRDKLEEIAEDLGAGIPSAILPAHTRPQRDITTAVAMPPVSLPAEPAGGGWRRPVIAAAVSGLMVSGLVIGAMWFMQGGANRPEAAADTEAEAQAETGTRTDGLDDASFAEIDRELLAKRGDEALAIIKPLKDRYPDDARLLWREGRALALAKGGNKNSLALAAYGDALERDPALLDDHDFYAQILELMQDRKLRDQALDLALQKMGDKGNSFLLELVNEQHPARALPYADRHRALDALLASEDAAPRVDRRINWARDLWQSSRGKSPAPCADFKQAIADIDATSDPYFLPGVGKAKAPEPGPDEGEPACEGAAEALAALQTKLASLEVEAEAATGASGATGEPANDKG